jgi:hypothetical protein
MDRLTECRIHQFAEPQAELAARLAMETRPLGEADGEYDTGAFERYWSAYQATLARIFTEAQMTHTGVVN